MAFRITSLIMQDSPMKVAIARYQLQELPTFIPVFFGFHFCLGVHGPVLPPPVAAISARAFSDSDAD